MSLPAFHPLGVIGVSPVTPGSFVRRGLIQWSTPNSYTRQNGTSWTAQTGSTFTGSVTPGIATTPGGYNAIDLSTAGNFTADTSFNIPGALTADVWVRFSNTIAASGTAYAESSNNSYTQTNTAITFIYSATVGNRIRFTVGGNSFDTSLRGFIISDVWHHLALVIPGTGTQTCVGYWNGTSNASSSISVTRPAASFFSINRTSTGIRGQIGEVKVYNVALDSSEIRQNYNALAPYYGRPVIV